MRTRNAIDSLIVQGKPITFASVSREAKVSTAYLYDKKKSFHGEINGLRKEQRIDTILSVMSDQKRQVSDKSKDGVIGAKNVKILSLEREKKDLQVQNAHLKRELEVARGKLLEAIIARP